MFSRCISAIVIVFSLTSMLLLDNSVSYLKVSRNANSVLVMIALTMFLKVLIISFLNDKIRFSLILLFILTFVKQRLNRAFKKIKNKRVIVITEKSRVNKKIRNVLTKKKQINKKS